MSVAEDSPSLKDIDFSGWMDRYVKSLLAVGIPSYLAMEGYERYLQARNARTARQRVNRINRNPSSRSRRGEL